MSARSNAPANGWRDLVSAVVIVGLIAAVHLLPPDTSFAQMKELGLLKVCVPTEYPPLVTGNKDSPGFDIALLEAVARKLNVRLVVNANPAIGRDFNPRNWRVTRAQCQVIAGGVVVSDTTRSFLDTTPPHLETGWAMISAANFTKLHDARVGFYAGLAGLDRIALSRFLQANKARVEIVNSSAVLSEGLRSGRFDVGVSEALVARQIAGESGWSVSWVSDSFGRLPVAIGLWKGDLSLKRRLVSVLDELRDEGLVRDLARQYRIDPIATAITAN